MNEGEPPRRHHVGSGSGPQDPPPPPPAPPVPPAAPPRPEPDPRPEPVPLPGPLQPEPVQPCPQPEPAPPRTPEQVPPLQPIPVPAPPAYPGAAPAYPGAPAPPAPYGPPAYPGAPAPPAADGRPGPAYPAQPGPPHPGPPYPEPPHGARPGGPKKSSRGALWGLIGGGAAALIVLVLVLALLVIPAIMRSSVTAADAVKDYLTAVSRSDAKTALGYLDGVRSKDLLTDAVLKESNRLAPISRITVKQGRAGSGTNDVMATFSVGGKNAAATFRAYRIKDDWKIANGVQTITFSSLKGLGASVNGVPTARLAEAYVFPGTYRLSLASRYFSFEGDSTFTVIAENDVSAPHDVRVTLNDAGITAYRSLVRASVEACVAMKTLATPCGMDITSIHLPGAAPVEGTVTRTLTAQGEAALDALAPESSGSAPAVVTSRDTIGVDMTLQGSDGQTYTVTFGGYLDTPEVDFGTADPKVVWER